jgi:hypothetical protein
VAVETIRLRGSSTDKKLVDEYDSRRDKQQVNEPSGDMSDEPE